MILAWDGLGRLGARSDVMRRSEACAGRWVGVHAVMQSRREKRPHCFRPTWLPPAVRSSATFRERSTPTSGTAPAAQQAQRAQQGAARRSSLFLPGLLRSPEKRSQAASTKTSF